MKKILFVDDEKEMHPLIQSYFPKDKYRTICAFDGLEGMQKCRNEDFDLIILDYRMPKMDGLKFYHQLRDLQESRKVEHTPIIFVSGDIDELKSKFSNWQKCEFLKKPFESIELFQKIKILKEGKGSVTEPKLEAKMIISPGQELIQEGQVADHIFYVVSGMLECSVLKDGKSIVTGTVGPGELVGGMGLVNDSKCPMTVTAVEKCELIPIPNDKIMTIINSQPKWIKLMLESLNKRLAETIKRIA